MNEGWSYAPKYHRVKTPAMLAETYRRVRDKNAVFLLNIGPRSFGDIHPQEQTILREMGQMIRSTERGG